MVLYTKCIFKPSSPDEGWRISVMSRHTLNDGVTPDTRIGNDTFHVWMRKFLAPPDTLVKVYYEGLSWEGFREQYLAHLLHGSMEEPVIQLAQRALREDLTLLCVEETAEKCHRGLLAERCKLYVPSLEVIHR
jgi:uncharacterized protein YeaO (DUF488 family)